MSCKRDTKDKPILIRVYVTLFISGDIIIADGKIYKYGKAEDTADLIELS